MYRPPMAPVAAPVHMAAVGLLKDDRGVLMVESRYPTVLEPFWALPGGMLEPARGLRRHSAATSSRKPTSRSSNQYPSLQSYGSGHPEVIKRGSPSSANREVGLVNRQPRMTQMA